MKTKNSRKKTKENNLSDYLFVEKELMENMSSSLMSGQKQHTKIVIEFLNIIVLNLNKFASSDDFFLLLNSLDKRTAFFDKNASMLKDILTNLKGKGNTLFIKNNEDNLEFEKHVKVQFEKFYERVFDFVLVNQSGLDIVIKYTVSVREFLHPKMEETKAELSGSTGSFNEAIQNVVDTFFVNWTLSGDRFENLDKELNDQFIGRIDSIIKFWADLMRLNYCLQDEKFGNTQIRKSIKISDDLNHNEQVSENSLQH